MYSIFVAKGTSTDFQMFSSLQCTCTNNSSSYPFNLDCSFLPQPLNQKCFPMTFFFGFRPFSNNLSRLHKKSETNGTGVHGRASALQLYEICLFANSTHKVFYPAILLEWISSSLFPASDEFTCGYSKNPESNVIGLLIRKIEEKICRN